MLVRIFIKVFRLYSQGSLPQYKKLLFYFYKTWRESVSIKLQHKEGFRGDGLHESIHVLNSWNCVLPPKCVIILKIKRILNQISEYILL